MPTPSARSMVRKHIDLIVAVAITLVVTVVAARFDLFELWYQFTRNHEELELDEITVFLIGVLSSGMWLAHRRGRAARRETAERVRAQKALLARTRELERSNEELRHFASVAAHDLQEPIRIMVTYAQLLERRYRNSPDSDTGVYVGMIVDSGLRMRDLVRGLLAYSEVGSRGDGYGPIDMGAVLATAVSALGNRLAEHETRLDVAPGIEHLPSVVGNREELLLLVQNLLANALDHRAPDRPPEITVRATRQADEWVFSVQDNGPGIEPQYQERIFRMFQRLSSWHAGKGVGIGLAICRKIIENHGGRIWVESEPGRSTTFLFTLPADGVQASTISGSSAGR